MTDVHVFLPVGIALVSALAIGELLDRAGEPVILREILAGIVLGTHVLGVVDPDGTSRCLRPSGRCCCCSTRDMRG